MIKRSVYDFNLFLLFKAYRLFMLASTVRTYFLIYMTREGEKLAEMA
jgi:hypothetical protein